MRMRLPMRGCQGGVANARLSTWGCPCEVVNVGLPMRGCQRGVANARLSTWGCQCEVVNVGLPMRGCQRGVANARLAMGHRRIPSKLVGYLLDIEEFRPSWLVTCWIV